VTQVLKLKDRQTDRRIVMMRVLHFPHRIKNIWRWQDPVNYKWFCWEYFSSPPYPERLWSPSSLLSNGYWGVLSPGLKRPAREADHSPPTSAEVKNAWSYTSTHQCVFMAWCLVKHRENFIFTLLYSEFVRGLDSTARNIMNSYIFRNQETQ
jgi:hypothetical protein